MEELRADESVKYKCVTHPGRMYKASRSVSERFIVEEHNNIWQQNNGF